MEEVDNVLGFNGGVSVVEEGPKDVSLSCDATVPSEAQSEGSEAIFTRLRLHGTSNSRRPNSLIILDLDRIKDKGHQASPAVVAYPCDVLKRPPRVIDD